MGSREYSIKDRTRIARMARDRMIKCQNQNRLLARSLEKLKEYYPFEHESYKALADYEIEIERIQKILSRSIVLVDQIIIDGNET